MLSETDVSYIIVYWFGTLLHKEVDYGSEIAVTFRLVLK